MSLSSVPFLLFLVVVAVLYFLVPKKLQNPVLLLASVVFYVWAAPEYAPAIVVCTIASFLFAKAIAKREDKRKKRAILIPAIVLNIVLLAAFKYFNFFVQVFASPAFLESFAFRLLLPMGISYFTFQATGYLIDVYRGTVQPERNFFDFALFLSFFPYVSMGPIGRAGELLPQFKAEHRFQYGQTVQGLQRFLFGAFKKLAIADTLAVFVNDIYGPNLHAEEYTGMVLLVAVFGFALQLYFDFSGYTDMAVGVAKILGFELRENFITPYFSFSVSEFWGRWHMSLMSWFRDYIYIPLGGNKKGFARKLLNVVIIFLISGVWHVSTLSWSLVVWGAWLALFRVIEEIITRARGLKKPEYKTRVMRVLMNIGTNFIIVVGWLFFWLSMDDVGYVFKNLFRFAPAETTRAQLLYIASNGIADTTAYYVLFLGGLGVSLLIALFMDIKVNRSYRAGAVCLNPLGQVKKGRWLLYWLMGLLTAMFYLIHNTSGSLGQFIYQGY